MRRRRLFVIVAVAIGLLQFGESADALVLPMTTEELAAAADLILFATVEKIVQPDPNRYLLEVHLKPTETLKGEAQKGPFVLRLIGGVVNGIGLFSSEDPHFQAGKPVIVFLRPEAFPTAPVVGGRQGCLHVQNGMVIEKRVGAQRFLRFVRAKVAEQGGKEEPE